MYRVKYSKQVVKFLQKQNKEIRTKIVNFFDNIKNNSNFKDFKDYDVKRLKGFESVYRLRISKFRVIFSIEKEKSLIKVIKASSDDNVVYDGIGKGRFIIGDFIN